MERSVFNPAQLEILDLMSYVDNEDTLNEIKDMLSRYFAQKAEEGIDKLWEEGKINDLVIENWKHAHLRTPLSSPKMRRIVLEIPTASYLLCLEKGNIILFGKTSLPKNMFCAIPMKS